MQLALLQARQFSDWLLGAIDTFDAADAAAGIVHPTFASGGKAKQESSSSSSDAQPRVSRSAAAVTVSVWLVLFWNARPCFSRNIFRSCLFLFSHASSALLLGSSFIWSIDFHFTF